MANKIIFSGDDSYGTLDSTIGLATGQSISMIFNSSDIPDVAVHYLTSNTAGTSAISLSEGDFKFEIRYAGVTSGTNTSSAFLYDGNDHEIEVSRSGTIFTFTVDGVVVDAITKGTIGTNPMDIDHVCYDPNTGDSIPCLIEDLTIDTSTYFPLTTTVAGVVDDTSVNGNDLTLTNATIGTLSEWEWIGDFVHIYKTYQPSGGGLAYERRKEGIRKRIVCGFSMSDARLKQAGQEIAAGVTAYNRTQATTLTADDAGGISVDCDEETFTPLAGTGIFEQKQKWVSWSTASY